MTQQAAAGKDTALAGANAVELQLASVGSSLDDADAAREQQRESLARLVLVEQHSACWQVQERGIGEQLIQQRCRQSLQHGIEVEQI